MCGGPRHRPGVCATATARVSRSLILNGLRFSKRTGSTFNISVASLGVPAKHAGPLIQATNTEGSASTGTHKRTAPTRWSRSGWLFTTGLSASDDPYQLDFQRDSVAGYDLVLDAVPAPEPTSLALAWAATARRDGTEGVTGMANRSGTPGRIVVRRLLVVAASLTFAGAGVRRTCASPPVVSRPATQPGDEGLPNPFLSAEPESHQDAGYAAAIAAAEASLDRCPPGLTVPPERRDALAILDLVFHDPFARERAAVRAFHMRQAGRTVEALEHDASPATGATVYLFYNMGFIVRTRTVTLGFDLIRANHLGGFAVPDDLMRRVVNRCDALFVSHAHLDHADPWVARALLDQRKPVVAPPDLWAGEPVNAELTKLARDARMQQSIRVGGGKLSLGVVVDPGFQAIKAGDSVTCNVYIVRTPDGLVIAHTGDNNTYRPKASGWTDAAGAPQRIDVLLFNDWTVSQSPGALRGYNPRLVIGGHYDELGHDNVNARAPYWRGLAHADKAVYPWLVMTWGESFHYDRAAVPPSPTTRSATPGE